MMSSVVRHSAAGNGVPVMRMMTSVLAQHSRVRRVRYAARSSAAIHRPFLLCPLTSSTAAFSDDSAVSPPSSSSPYGAFVADDEHECGHFSMEPDSEEVSETLRLKRDTYACAVRLGHTVDSEIRAEVQRDSMEGFAAVPPLAPAGWAVQHSAGSNFFVMNKTIYKEKELTLLDGSEELGPLEEHQQQYRSVHDEHAGRLSHQQQRQRQREETAQPKSLERQRWVLGKGGQYKKPSSDATSSSAAPRSAFDVCRSNVSLTLFAPFRVQDLSLYDPTVSICEWSCFDLLVRKTPPDSERGRGTPAADQHDRCSSSSKEGEVSRKALLEGQRRVWDQRQCLFVRLASVNSELRVRSVQLISTHHARALEEFAVFGRGDPLYLELLRRLRSRAKEKVFRRGSARSQGRQKQSPHHAARASSIAQQEQRYDEPTRLYGPSATRRAAVAAAPSATADPRLLLSDESITASEALLATTFDGTGDFARSLCYAGPYITELSREFREALLTYLMTDLHINAQLVEYVCQMQYFLEQEEYMGWLARWGHLTRTIQRYPGGSS